VRLTCSVRMSDSEQMIVHDYARFHGITVSQAFRQALLERIEDEMDAKVADLAYEMYRKNPVKLSHEDAWKEILGDD